VDGLELGTQLRCGSFVDASGWAMSKAIGGRAREWAK
jgi:hypothetical protein